MHYHSDTPVIIIGNGTTDKNIFDDISKTYTDIYAADGGANTLQHWNIIPKAVIGDLDSLEDRDFFASQCDIVEIKEQNSTDLQKCLRTIDAPLYIVFGCTGDRFDHCLEILHILLANPDKKIVFMTEIDMMFCIPQNWKAKLPVATRFSIWPLKKTSIINSTGLKYPLDNLVVDQASQIGTSNETDAQQVSINSQDTGLLAITPYANWRTLLHTL
jgi:thiamine pyrophosphokinase